MPPDFLLSQWEWPQSVRQALSLLEKAAKSGETSSVEFRFGPPRRGRLPFQIIIDGRTALRCEISDTNRSFLQDLRAWMEGCFVQDRDGWFHPGLLTLDLADDVLFVVIIHMSWEDDSARPLFYFTAFRRKRARPVYCFCYGIDTICGLYESLLDCLIRYRKDFDNPAVWHDVKRYDLLDPVTTTERLLAQIRSRKLDYFCTFTRK